MKFKRGIASLLALVMLMAMLPGQIVSASGLIDPTNKVKIEFVPMKYKDTVIDEFTNDPEDEGYSNIDEVGQSSNKDPDGNRFRDYPLVEETTRPEIDDIDFSTEYMVGIKISGFTNIEEAQNGLINFTLPIMFDSEYIEITDTINTNFAKNLASRLGMRSVDNIFSEYYLTGSSGSPNYIINGDSVGTYTGMVSLPIKAASSTAASLTSDDEFYLGVIKYKFSKAPEASGTDIFTLSMDDTRLSGEYANYFTAGFYDTSGNTMQYQPSPGETDIRELFEVDATLVNYPKSYSVNFYTDNTYATAITSASGATLGAVGVAEGTAIADAGIVEPVAGTDFDLINAEGKYFSEFKYVDAAGAERSYAALATIGADAAVDSGTEIKVYPVYIEGTDLTFNSNYPTDSSLSDETTTVTVSPADDATIPKSSEPSVGTAGTEDFTIPTGYVFGGWYDNAACTGDAIVFDDTDDDSDSPTLVANLAGTDIYAKWVNAIKVEFVKVLGDTAQDNVVETYYIDPDASDKTVSAPASNPTRTGYVFDAWYYDDNGTETAFVAKGNTGATEFSANTTVYAKWKKSVKVIYYDTDKTTELKNETIVTGDNFTPPTVNDDTANNKYFNGWKNKADDTTVDTSQALSADVTVDTLELYADMKDAYTVKFYKEAEKTNLLDTKYSNSVTPAALGSANMPTDPTETGKKFSGWKVVGTDATFDETTVVNGDMEVYAAWDSLWKIDFYEDSADTSAETKYVDPDVKTLGSDMPADPATRTGYRFEGYYIDGTNTKVDGTTEFSGDTKVVGKWTQLFEVEFYDTLADAQAGTNKLANETVDSGNKVTAATVPTTNDNDTDKKYFKGWKTTDGTSFDPANDVVTSDLKLYRDWGDYHKVEFYKETTDIGTSVYDTKYVNPNVGNTVSSLPTNPTKTGYGFNEWKIYDSTSSSVTTTKFDTSTQVTGDMIVVADWTQKVKISFYPNDGTGTNGLGTVVEEYVTPNVTFDGTVPTVQKTGYTLKEWNTASNGSGTSYTNVAAATFSAATTLYAIWTADGPDTATLTFDANLSGVTPNPSSVTVNVNDKVYTSNIPVVAKDNYTFDGWYASPSISDTTKIDFSTGYTVTQDKTVYAHWTYTGADAVTVKFDNEGSQYATVTVAPNTTLGTMMPTNPTKTGYAFKEWNMASDGTGTKFESTTNVGAGPATVTVYAQWIEDITVNYDANGGTNGPASVTKPAANAYEEPNVDNMSKGDYTFVGWNTEQNGSGTYVEADGTLTYAQVADMFTPAGGTAPTTVTLYAQWALVPNDDGVIDDIIDDDPVDPDSDGVRVTFDSNAVGATTTVVDANPKYKYPKLGDTIGTDNMPNDPTREKYVFKGWNTAQDGSGVTFSGTTTVDSTTLGTALVEIMENDADTGKYEVTLYAQWELAPDVLPAEAVTITFNKNLDGSGAAGDVIKTVTLYKGDPLGYDIPAPTNGTYEFNGWYAGSVVDGKVSFDTNNKFTATTPITDSVDYYAQWQMYLLVQVQPKIVDGAQVDYTYTGLEIKPEYKVFQITYPNGNQQPYEIVDPTTPIYTGDFTNSQFKVEYKKDGSVATLKDAGTYTINASFADGSALQAAGAQIAVTDAPTIEIKPAGLTFKVNPETQVQKAGKVTLPTPTSVEGIQNNEVAATIYDNAYYAWTDSDNDDNIADAELATTTAADVGDYVWKIELKSSNYVIEKVESSVDGKDVLKYGVTTDYPTYTGSKEGQNLVLEVIPNDPSIKTVAIKSVDNVDEDNNPVNPAVEENLTLKKNDYTTDETFDNAEEPTVTDYYIRVTDKDADEVTFTLELTNPDTTTLTATGGTAVDNGDGTWTITAPLTSKGATPNVVTVTTKAGSDADAPTITYTFNIQQLVEAKIVLNYGNSPYGEIMKDDAITDKDAAKAAFDVGNKYGTGYVPANAASKANVMYGTRAWVDIVNLGNVTADEQAKIEDSSINMDRNEHAIFIYNGTTFVDPGFVATDSLGETVTNVTRKITVDRMQANQLAGLNDTNVLADEITIADQPSNYLITEITKPYNYADSSSFRIRPDVYTMEYSFVDPVSGETVTEERNVVVLQHRGDSYCTDLINDSSVNPIYSYLKTYSTFDGMTGKSRNIYFYRVLDTDASNLINDSDANPIYSYLKSYIPNPTTVSNPLDSLYVELPNTQ